MEEQWIQWKPIQGLSRKYHIKSILDNLGELKIILCDEKYENKLVTVTFDGTIASYKWTDETYRLKTIALLDKKYGKNFYGNWTFFKITNSLYLQLLSEDSFTIADSRSLIHFSLIDANSIVDIIATCEPIVELVE